ncbi:hypothetical protein BKA67DRAFT_401570 [Truncatella angustata]|uniref:Uncharacterized protein n=1 Tax=Truncatella angustata TaxID=152316 RepID=A0A9P8RR10_9PEZI|nr:uncharacterized protein BKA67DRAFT_401570 [Truncatella angustata]KAH6647953.1 hypothetical protein BKA67DRAFT_401570 [Truncatella angustata]KAH8203662.1 hypothetical protein TruAng_002192 [Truncatella angustata]
MATIQILEDRFSLLYLPSLVDHYVAIIEWFLSQWTLFSHWLAQPHVLAVILAWAITFTVICSIFMALGFGPVGVGAATIAAAFQSCMYGGFTPAGGIFATLTSMAMLGTFMPVAAFLAAVVATIVSTIVWACGTGR